MYIGKEERFISLEFERNILENDKNSLYLVVIYYDGSRYASFNHLFMKLYEKLNSYDPKEHDKEPQFTRKYPN